MLPLQHLMIRVDKMQHLLYTIGFLYTGLT
jgi:hypothetical protein